MDSNTIIINLKNKWSTRLDEHNAFKEFILDWKLTDDCRLTEWANGFTTESINEVNNALLEQGKKNKQMLQAIHFHIGCLLPYEMRIEWTKIIANDSGVSCIMLNSDVTLTNEQVEILKLSAINAPNLYNGIIYKDYNQLFNPDSEIIQNILGANNG